MLPLILRLFSSLFESFFSLTPSLPFHISSLSDLFYLHFLYFPFSSSFLKGRYTSQKLQLLTLFKYWIKDLRVVSNREILTKETNALRGLPCPHASSDPPFFPSLTLLSLSHPSLLLSTETTAIILVSLVLSYLCFSSSSSRYFTSTSLTLLPSVSSTSKRNFQITQYFCIGSNQVSCDHLVP